ncbi:hypothetical protein MOC16_gp371 [Klebsiella phage vB_KpM_FBKp24]|uniref:Uncharacterized protein n=1 Tax=Klebsiella phage vB_KpM_FBKp24 TaxID=2801834 RepID=A0A7U0J7A9_9CAUD|nr:hypothetical protein MOC16_gp371 [Klebsiella phage vB_KpM_FBKp24]QQV92352.1 hypothetical protein vBKpMFBKp24_042 [Klebsiella phage vB_KpM_FBKp24]
MLKKIGWLIILAVIFLVLFRMAGVLIDIVLLIILAGAIAIYVQLAFRKKKKQSS